LYYKKHSEQKLFTKRNTHTQAYGRRTALTKAPFIATQLNSIGRPVELSCVAINDVARYTFTTRWVVSHRTTQRKTDVIYSERYVHLFFLPVICIAIQMAILFILTFRDKIHVVQ